MTAPSPAARVEGEAARAAVPLPMTWRRALAPAMAAADDPGPVLAYAPNEAAFDVEFDDGYGGSQGPNILAWTADNVYFPVVYDGSEWIGRAPRHPQPEGQGHVGGE